jgi:hypothetical protein
MAEYEEISITGRRYKCPERLIVDHPKVGTTSFNFVEERVSEYNEIPSETKPSGNLIFPYNAAETFIVYNSSTGEPYPATALSTLAVGGQILFKMSFLKEVILSLYKAKAEERDG